MLYDAFRELLLDVIAEIYLWITDMADFLVESSLKIESALWSTRTPLTRELVQSIYNYVYGAILLLVVLKFIWKGFQVYVLWRDGDADVSPHNLIVGACMALVVSLAFPTVYNIGVAVTCDITDGIIETVEENWTDRYIPNVSSVEPRAEAIWGEFFAPLDTDGDGSVSEKEWDSADPTISLWNRDTDGKPIDEGAAGWGRLFDAFPELWSEGTTREDVVDSAWLNTPLQISALAKRGRLNQGWIADELMKAEKSKLVGILNPVKHLSNLILLLIYLILYVIMYLKLLARGVEMLFLRWGLPIASIGLINSDGGIFPSYVQLLLKQMATSMLQVVAMFLSFYIVMDFSLTSILLALAMIGVAFRAPVLLSQVLAPQRQGGGLTAKAYSGMMMWRMLRRGK